MICLGQGGCTLRVLLGTVAGVLQSEYSALILLVISLSIVRLQLKLHSLCLARQCWNTSCIELALNFEQW